MKGSRMEAGVCFAGRTGAVLLFLGLAAIEAGAQPSGGPYGPVRQAYAVPADVRKVYYVAPDGQSARQGETLGAPTTLEAATEKARTGDVILMRGGTYRTGNLLLNQGITLQPYADERPVMKGTLVATQWESLGNGLWTTRWPRLFPSKPADWWRRNREGKKTPLHRFNNDMVFVDAKFLQSAGWEGDVDENSYFIDYALGLVYIGVDPTNRLVEITAHDVAILRTTRDAHGVKSDGKGYTLRGITFTQYAYRALEVEGAEPEGISEESKHGKDVVGTTLEDCVISYCSRVAGYFRGDRMTFRRCRVSDTSTEGLYIIASNDVLLEKTILARNNIENITGYYPAAVKIFNQCYRVTCRDNLVIDQPNSNGIWYDVGNVDGIFINNWIEGVGRIDRPMLTNQLWPSDNGFFFEISRGAVCAGNVFVNCDHGLMVLNSSDVQIYNNTFVNSTACIGRNERVAAGDHFGWHASTGPDVEKRDGHLFVNNLLTAGEGFTRPLLFTWQPPALCERLPRPLLSRLDNNVYIREGEGTSTPLILWSPAPGERCQAVYDGLESLRKSYPQFAASSRYYTGYGGSLFISRELGNYRLSAPLPEVKPAGLPEHIWRLLGRPGRRVEFVGAYPTGS